MAAGQGVGPVNTAWVAKIPESRDTTGALNKNSTVEQMSITDLSSNERVEWRCFHCDEVFTDRQAAADHFGVQIDGCADDVACKINATDGLLVSMLREAQAELREYRQEDNAAFQQFHALGAEHATALRREEEKGYARGLEDAKKHPELIGLMRANETKPSRNAEHCEFSDCEQHNALVIAMMLPYVQDFECADAAELEAKASVVRLAERALAARPTEKATITQATITSTVRLHNECPVCRRALRDDEVLGSCANTKDGHHRRVLA